MTKPYTAQGISRVCVCLCYKGGEGGRKKKPNFALRNLRTFPKVITFLAYFQILKNTLLSALCPSVCLSVCNATTFHGVDRLGRFMVRSIAYDPRIRTTKGIFFWTGPGPNGRGLKSNSLCISYRK